MPKRKIIADSSANLLQLPGVDFAVAPLKILAGDREFVDDAALDTNAMVQWFDSYKGRSKTSCPNTADWLHAFEDAEEVFCVTITSGLSGSYNAACAAKELYESEHPGRRVCVIDSLSAGPELELILEKLADFVAQDMPYEEICLQIGQYQKQTGLLFMLKSLKNFAANGRVSPAVAKIAGVLGIHIVGKASDHGTLEPLSKNRGEGKALPAILEFLEKDGFSGGKVRISHCLNTEAAQKLKQLICDLFPCADVRIRSCLGLCSYYAEKGGLLLGYERL